MKHLFFLNLKLSTVEGIGESAVTGKPNTPYQEYGICFHHYLNVNAVGTRVHILEHSELFFQFPVTSNCFSQVS